MSAPTPSPLRGRPPGRGGAGAAIIVGVLALVVGISIGLFLGRASVPTLAEQTTQLRAQADGLATVLADAGAIYGAGYDDPAARAEAVDAARRVNGELGQLAAAFAAVDPAGYAAAVTAVAAAATALADGIPPPEAATTVAAAVERLRALAGQPSSER